MRQRIFLLLFSVLASGSLTAQNFGEWTSYTSMKRVRALSASSHAVWAATEGGVFRYVPGMDSTDAFTTFTNIEGLAGIDASSIAVTGQRVLVGFGSGNINMLDGDRWTLVPDIARSTNYTRRGINTFAPYRDRVFVGTEFGVTEFFPDTREFGDTYVQFGSLPSPASVNRVVISAGTIWVATDRGVAQASLSASNLQEPDSWTSYTVSEGLPANNTLTLQDFRGEMIAGTESGVAVFRNGSWAALPAFPSGGVVDLASTGDTLYVLTKNDLFRATALDNLEKLHSSAPGVEFTNLFLNTSGQLWMGTTDGIVEHRGGDAWIYLKPDGPNSNQFTSLAISTTGVLWAASGRDAQGKGFYGFDGTHWMNYTTTTHPEIESNSYLLVAAAPNGAMVFGGWGAGLLVRYRDGTLQRFDETNVPDFPGVVGGPGFNAIGGVAVDRNGTVWIVHFRTGNGSILSAFTADSTWYFFSNPVSPEITYLTQLVIDAYGTKWIMPSNGSPFQGLVYFNDSGTLEDWSDDTWGSMSVRGPEGLDAAKVTALAVDRTGDLWIGTDIGLRTIFNTRNPERVIKTCNNTLCNIEGQYITCIAIDPLNNKWIGTKNGVFVLSADGGFIIAQYNESNSPLLSNEVRAIVVHPQTGVAYIGTDKGLSALRTTSILPRESFEKLRVSPNPFRPGLHDEVYIDGLVEETTLKIVTPDGALVAEIPTPGGRIGSWDGRARDGSLVRPGVYFIIAYNYDGTKAAVGKIAVIR